MESSPRTLLACPHHHTPTHPPTDACPHIFSRRGIEELFAQHAKAKSVEQLHEMGKHDAKFLSISMPCPVSGCKSLVCLAAIKDDSDMAVLIDEFRRRTEEMKEGR